MDTFWAEIRIDSQRYKELFRSKKNKGAALKKSLTQDSIEYIKKRFGFEKLDDLKAIKQLIKSNNKDANDIYILSKSYDQFSTIKKYYVQEINGGNENDDLYCILRLYFEKPDVLKKVFYSTFLKTKEVALDTYNLKAPEDFNVQDLDGIKERQAQKLARDTLKTKKQKEKINVWYVLPDGEAVNLFIFKRTSVRARIPSANSKKYRFFSMSKPIIIQFNKNAKKVSILSKEKKTTLQMAKGIVCQLAGKEIDDPKIVYVKRLAVNKKAAVDAFIKGITQSEHQKFALEQIRVKTNRDSHLIVLKKSRAIQSLLGDLVQNYTDTGLDSTNVGRIMIKFNNKRFDLLIETNDNKNYSVEYNGRVDFENRTEFEKQVKQDYGVEISKRG